MVMIKQVIIIKIILKIKTYTTLEYEEGQSDLVGHSKPSIKDTTTIFFFVFGF